MGNGNDTLFWDDIWLDDVALKVQYPRIYALELCKHINVADNMNLGLTTTYCRVPRGGAEEVQQNQLLSHISDLVLPQMIDRWVWKLEASSIFSVNSVCNLIDDRLLPKEEVPTRWVKVIPIKVNIFAWKVCSEKLPAQLNISLREVGLNSILCPLCNAGVESSSHIFFSCSLARNLRRLVLRWWVIEDSDLSSYDDWLAWLNNVRIPNRLKEILEGVCYVMWWLIWRFRNQSLFGNCQPRRDYLFDDLVQTTFNWCSCRSKCNLNWAIWLQNPSLLNL